MTARKLGDAPRISDEDLGKVLELIGGSDSVELKATVAAESYRATIDGLGLDPVEAQPRQVFFWDTPDLALDAAGVVVRARRIQGGKADTVIKLRPVDPAQVPDELRRSSEFKLEVDLMPGAFVCSGSLKGRATGTEVRDAVAGELPLRKLFSKQQRAFFEEHAPAGVTFDDLVPLGPTFILKGTVEPKKMKRRFVAEVWLYQDGSRLMELSTKCLPGETFAVVAETRNYLNGIGIEVDTSGSTKTRSALNFFRSRMGGGAAKPAEKAKGSSATPAIESKSDESPEPMPAV
jgi:hypothetical protein